MTKEQFLNLPHGTMILLPTQDVPSYMVVRKDGEVYLHNLRSGVVHSTLLEEIQEDREDYRLFIGKLGVGLPSRLSLVSTVPEEWKMEILAQVVTGEYK